MFEALGTEGIEVPLTEMRIPEGKADFRVEIISSILHAHCRGQTPGTPSPLPHFFMAIGICFIKLSPLNLPFHEQV